MPQIPGNWPAVWCEECATVQPLIVDVLPADERNETAACDLVCSSCRLILLTLHAKDVGPVQTDAEFMAKVVARG